MELEQQVEGVGGNRVSIGGQLLGGGQDKARKVQVRNVHVGGRGGEIHGSGAGIEVGEQGPQAGEFGF